MPFTKSVAVFITRIFALAVPDGLMSLAPFSHAAINVVLVRQDQCSGMYGFCDDRFDRLLFDIGEPFTDHGSSAFDHSENRRFFFLKRAAAAISLSSTSASGSPFFFTASGWP